jgi:sterol O-acyltransferase
VVFVLFLSFSSSFFLFIIRETIQTYKVSQESATIVTFLISAVLHEYFMSMVFRLFRPYFFGMQLTQLPLIFFARMLKGTRFGNVFFWFGMTLGPPMLAVWYSREFFLMKTLT